MVRRKTTKPQAQRRARETLDRLANDLRTILRKALRDPNLVESLPRLQRSLAKVKVEGWRFKLVYLPDRRTLEDAAESSILTARQIQTAVLVRQGLSNKEIADVLGISNYTVSNQMQKVFRRLNINSRASLATYAERFVR